MTKVIRTVFASLSALLLCLSVPAFAHKGDKHGGDAPAHDVMIGTEIVGVNAIEKPPMPEPGMLERSGNWIGRLHPAIVHFPIALTPLALLALLLARRRKQHLQTARFLLIAAGLSAPTAAIVGWLGAVPSWWDADPVIAWHRWIGTFLGVILAVIGWVAWKQPARLSQHSMTLALVVLTLLLFTQGWLGGAMIHGLDHLNW